MRVVFIILDGMPARHVSPSVTPSLCALGPLSVGESVMTSATYPNHATFITGVLPSTHGIVANFVMVDDRLQPAHRVGPSAPTLFDAVPRSVAVLGDHRLVGVMGARGATVHWPPEGRIPASVSRDRYDYAADREVLTEVRRIVDEPWELLVVHFNEPDTAGHIDGPDSEAAAASYRDTDAALGGLLEILGPWWDDLVVIVVSDHDQRTADPSLPALSLEVPFLPEGDAAIVWGELPAVPFSVIEVVNLTPSVHALCLPLGHVWAIPAGVGHGEMRGYHGGLFTRDQVVVVGGGHPAVGALTGLDRPRADQWAPTIASLLGVSFPSATGTSLI